VELRNYRKKPEALVGGRAGESQGEGLRKGKGEKKRDGLRLRTFLWERKRIIRPKEALQIKEKGAHPWREKDWAT